MTAAEILERSGDIARFPLLDTARALHCPLTGAGIRYVIIGWLAVVRNGAPRTTRNVDLLGAGDGRDMVLPLPKPASVD